MTDRHKVMYYKLVRFGKAMPRTFATVEEAKEFRALLSDHKDCVIRGYTAAGKVVADS